MTSEWTVGRRLNVSVLSCVFVAGVLSVDLNARPRTLSFDQLFRAYAAGDRDVLRRTVRTGADVQALRPPRDGKAFAKWLGPWNRAKAAFVLEFAQSESHVSAQHLAVIAVGREYVMARPTPFGQNPAEDAFEIAWHRMAMSLLEESLYARDQEAYLDALALRAKSAPVGSLDRLDARFALHLGIAQEQRCAALDHDQRAACQAEAVRRFGAATLVPDTASEALIRTAWLHTQRGEYARALESIDRACPTDDADLAYWMHLFRGRVLDALDRLPEAAADYEAALDVRPGAQSAGVGLALTWFKLARLDDAIAAARAVETSLDAIDPWWSYLLGDARFLDEWRIELRARLEP